LKGIEEEFGKRRMDLKGGGLSFIIYAGSLSLIKKK
jgi:hypothetical protein